MKIVLFILILIIGIYGCYRVHKGLFLSERNQTHILAIRLAKLLLLVFCVSMLLVQGDVEESDDANNVTIFLVDVSKSMDVEDIQTSSGMISRKRYVRELISYTIRQKPKTTYGVIVFADQARTLLPPTDDLDVVDLFLRNIESFNSLPGGSNFEVALQYASEYMERNTIQGNMIVLSDGGDEDGASLSSDVDIGDHWEKVSVFSVGSSSGGWVPDDPDVFGHIRPKIYQGQQVVSKRNDTHMNHIAEVLDGEFSQLDAPEVLLTSFGPSDFPVSRNMRYWIIVCGLFLYLMMIACGSSIFSTTKLGKK